VSSVQIGVNLLSINVGSVQTGVSSVAAQVNSNSVGTSSLHTRVSSVQIGADNIYTRIGVPIGASLVVDVSSVQVGVNSAAVQVGSNAVAVSSLHTRVGSVQTGADNIFTRVGAPVGASISTDISSVQIGVNSAAAEVASNAVAISSLHTRVTSAATQISSIFSKTDNLPVDPADQSLIIAATDALVTNIGSVQSGVNSLYARVGSPIGSDLSVDVASVQTGISSIAGGRFEANVAAVNSDVNAASNLRRGALATVVGNTTGDSTTSVISTANLSPAAGVQDQWFGRTLIFDRDTLTVNLRGQPASVNSMTAAGVLYVSSLTTAPTSGNTFAIV
jgi:hypothetical protein